MLASLSLSDAAAAATAFGVVLAASALFLQRGQARTQFEDNMVRQYREVIKPDLILDVVLERLFDGRSDDERQRIHHIYLYLDLCNEQVFLRAIGRVSRSTWRVQWSSGIRENLTEHEAIRQTWEVIKTQTHQFRELRVFEQTGWGDPRRWESVWRRTFVRFGLATLRVPLIEAARREGESRPGSVSGP